MSRSLFLLTVLPQLCPYCGGPDGEPAECEFCGAAVVRCSHCGWEQGESE